MKDNFIHVTFVIDESGSMWSSTSDVIGGFEKTINEQKQVKDGKCAVSLFKFCNKVEEVFLMKDVNEVEKLVYDPCGGTAMNDGIGTAIDKVGEVLAKMDESERPSKNLVVIMTDGQENSSKKYSFSKVKEMIKHQEEKYNWTFVYMGSDLTDVKDAEALGLSKISVSSKSNLGSTYALINSATTLYRKSRSASVGDAMMDSYLDSNIKTMTEEYEMKNNLKINKN